MPRAKQGQDRWHRPDWGAPTAPPPRRRWHLPLLLVLLGAVVAWAGLNPERVESLLDPLRSRWPSVAEAQPDAGASRFVYRWRDSKGVVQFTDRPPPEGIPYVPVHVDPNTNVLPPATSPWADR